MKYLILFVLIALLASCAEPQVDERKIDPATVSIGPYQHSELSDDLRQRVQAITDVFEHIDGISYDQAIDLYRRDRNPEPNIVIYEEMACVFTTYCANKCETFDEEKEVYRALLIISMLQPEDVIDQLQPRILGQYEFDTLIQEYLLPPIPITIISE